jgi:ABC-type uncharacterized transport system substrate-binding protein
MRRRDFIKVTAGSAAAWPLAALAQQPAMPVIGFLNSASPAPFAHLVRAFHQGLKEVGYVEGRNLVIEYRWAEGQYDRLPALAADLVRRQVAVICANGLATPPAKAATTTIPVVVITSVDPVAAGLVTSLSRPGGNLTGVTALNVEVAPKLLELSHELVPTATIVGFLVNPTNPNAETISSNLQVAARALGLKLHVLHANMDRDIDSAFATLVQLRAGALVIGGDAFLSSRCEQLAALAARHKLPAIYTIREFAAAGGLMSYGGSFTDPYRLAGKSIGRILMGEDPANLPVQQSTKVELVINLKTAKALGINIPLSLLGRADEVIE